MVVTRQTKIKPTAINQAWSMDFVADQLANGMKFRALTIVDVFSKEALAIEVGQRLRSEHVVATLNRLTAQRSAPKYLFVDNVLTALHGRRHCASVERVMEKG
jgi:putative transposase